MLDFGFYRNTTRQTIMISRIAGMAVCLFSGILGYALYVKGDPARDSAKDTTVRCGKCRITVLGTYFWRDWMPIVRSPGPDGGSPLHARVKLSLDNSAGNANTFTYRAAIVDNKGQSYSVPFRIFPNFRDLPDDNSKSRRTNSIGTEKAVPSQFNATWDGGLDPGEIREIELATAEGPYLSVGSSIHVRIEWTDKTGDMAVFSTPDEPIERTD
jgi:hypothetical protein